MQKVDPSRKNCNVTCYCKSCHRKFERESDSDSD